MKIFLFFLLLSFCAWDPRPCVCLLPVKALNYLGLKHPPASASPAPRSRESKSKQGKKDTMEEWLSKKRKLFFILLYFVSRIGLLSTSHIRRSKENVWESLLSSQQGADPRDRTQRSSLGGKSLRLLNYLIGPKRKNWLGHRVPKAPAPP